MESIEQFKTSINRVRDILRTLGISGMDSLRHICLYILSRYMSRELCTKLDVPIELCWENFIHLIREVNGGVDKAHDLFYHSELDSCLIKHFDRLFGTTDFPFNIKKAKKHAEILNILDAVDIKALDRHIDILGFVYELHLKTGASAARDLGQFFTDRNICKYMTDLCEPAFKEPGVPETVCDPTMGTGGFLTSFIKYYETTYPDAPINWSAQEKQINGCDTDPKVAGIARLNLFMETGGCRMNNILTYDSLYGDLPQVGYDVILANMPFGLKGIKHEECCKKIRDLKINGNKSEPLFLQLMCASLNSGGRCAVIVPDGTLTNTSKCHNETRKYLLNNFEVMRVVKMSGDFFMNTNIKTSIIFFKNSGTPTTHVEFWEVTKAKTGEIVEELIVDVPRDYFDENCSLNMKLYIAEEEKPVINPEEFPKMKLEDICIVSFGDRITQREHTGTIYPVYGSGNETFRTDNFNRSGKTCKIGRFAISEQNMVMIITDPYWLMDSGFTVETKDPKIILTEFLWYCLLFNKEHLYALSSGTCQKNIIMKDFYSVEYAVPPLEIQHEIVATLDRIYTPGTTKLADTLKLTDKAMDLVLANPDGTTLEPIVEIQQLIRKSVQMITDIKMQMIAIMKAVEKRKNSKMKLEDICNISFGDRITQKEHIGELYPVYGSGNETFRTDHFNRNGKTCKVGRFAISEQNMVMIVEGPYWLMDSGFTVESKDSKIILTEFLWYCLLLDKENLYTLSSGSCQKNIVMKDFYNIEYAIPSLAFQKDVIKRLDALQSQINALEQLQRQADDNARFILESYLPKSEVDDIEETVV